MTNQEIIDLVKGQFGDAVVSAAVEGLHPHIQVNPVSLVKVCMYLRDNEAIKFDLLRCITGIDWPAKNSIEVSYDIISTSHGHSLAVKVMLDRSNPKVETLSHVWPAANWHERETYDLMGVEFTNHPDFRRILMPEDWVGHPLRKDYQYPVEYHGYKIKP